jgi:hypothetical protein
MEAHPYRQTEQKPKNISELLALIETEGKFGILLPNNVRPGFEITQLTQLKNLNSEMPYKDIALYSEEHGVLHLNKNKDPEQDYSDQPINFVGKINEGQKKFFDFIDANHSIVITITYNPLVKNFTIFSINKDPQNIKTVFEK